MLVARDTLETYLLQLGNRARIDKRAGVLDYLLQFLAPPIQLYTGLICRKHIFKYLRPPLTLGTLRRLKTLRKHSKYVFPYLAWKHLYRGWVLKKADDINLPHDLSVPRSPFPVTRYRRSQDILQLVLKPQNLSAKPVAFRLR